MKELHGFILILSLVGCSSPALAQSLTNTFQNGAGGYTNEVDVSISTEYAAFTDGNGTTFSDSDGGGECFAWRLDDYETRALIRFDRLNLPGAKVASATLELTFDNYDTGFGYTGYYLQAAWNPLANGESGLGWLRRDTGLDWSVPGAGGLGSDLVAGKTFSLSGFQGTGHDVESVALDPAVVQSWVSDLAANQGVLLDITVSNVMPRIFGAGASDPSYRPQLTVVYTPGTPPTVAQPASALPARVAGATNEVSVLGADADGASSLAYFWSARSAPSGAPALVFSPNGSNAATNSSVTYFAAGSYTLQAVVLNDVGLTATSAVDVVVSPVFTSIGVSPSSAMVLTNTTQRFGALALDQFGNPLASQPGGLTWSVAGGGTIDSNGLFTAGAIAGGPFVVRAALNGVAGQGSVSVILPNIPPQVTLTSPVDGQFFTAPAQITLLANATDPDGSVTNVEFYENGVFLGQAASPPYSFIWANSTTGSFVLTAIAFDNQGASATSGPVNVTIGAAQNTQFTAILTASGSSDPLPLASDAESSPDGLTPAFNVGAPNAQAPRLLNFVNPAIAIPFNSPIRMVEAYWNGAPLPLLDTSATEVTEEPHSFGSTIPFFKPVFSLAAVPAGPGSLEIRAFDGSHVQLASSTVSNLVVSTPPAPVASTALAAMPHPRIYLTPARLAAARGRTPDDIALQRFNVAISVFTNELAQADVLSEAFANQVYDPEDYIPALALASQLHQNDDTNLAGVAAAAARALAVRVANEYDRNVIPAGAAYDNSGQYTFTNYLAGPGYYYTPGSNDISLAYSDDPSDTPLTQAGGFFPYGNLVLQGSRNQPVTAVVQRYFSRDDGYDIRFGLRDLMLAYDWLYDQFTPDERATIVRVATNWVQSYHTTPDYAETKPLENYFAGYLQGIILTAIATAGDCQTTDGILALLRDKLGNEMPVLNQRAAGGDWPEGWNYGPYSVLQFALANLALKDTGEDWSADFDWLEALPRSFFYMTSPDYSQSFSFGEYTGDYPDKTSPSMLAVLSATEDDGAFAALLYNRMNANPDNDFASEAEDRPSSEAFYEMIFATNSPPPVLSSLPLSYFNSGTGRFFSKSSLSDPEAYFVSAENTTYTGDHYGYSDGDVRLYHGTNALVAPSMYRGPQFAGIGDSTDFSTYEVNGETQASNSRNNANMSVVEAGTYASVVMRLESTWAPTRYDEDVVSADGPLDYMIREAVHLRPGTLVVRDLHRRRHLTDTLAAQFHLGPTNSVQAVGGGYQTGSLRVSTYYPAGVTVAFTGDTDGGGNPIGGLMLLGFTNSTAPLELVTVFSETLTGTSYTNGALALSDGSSVVFGSGGAISVTAGPVLALARLGDGSFQLALSGNAGVWQIESSTNLANWSAFATVTNLASSATLAIPNAGGTRFFRAATR
jgi:hypothetical protein